MLGNPGYFFMPYNFGNGVLGVVHYFNVNTNHPVIRIEIINSMNAEIEVL